MEMKRVATTTMATTTTAATTANSTATAITRDYVKCFNVERTGERAPLITRVHYIQQVWLFGACLFMLGVNRSV